MPILKSHFNLQQAEAVGETVEAEAVALIEVVAEEETIVGPEDREVVAVAGEPVDHSEKVIIIKIEPY